MNSCQHCGRPVKPGDITCPFCRKALKPPPESPTDASDVLKGPKKTYRWQFHPKGGASPAPETKVKGYSDLVQSLISGTSQVKEDAMDIILGKGLDLGHELAAALEDKTLAGRESAAKALGRMGSQTASPALIRSLAGGERPVKFASAWALFRLGDADAFPAFIQGLKDKDPQFRRYMVYLLGSMANRKASAHLLPLLEDPDPEVRGQTLNSLYYLEGRRSRRTLRAARNDSNEYVSRAAAELLGLMGESRGLWLRNSLIAVAVLLLILGGLWISKRGRKQATTINDLSPLMLNDK